MALRSMLEQLSKSPVTQETGKVVLPVGAYIDLPGHGRMFYRCCPNPGKPTILLLHGLAHSSGLAWCHSFEDLKPHYNIIAPDLPGHGRSDPPHSTFKLLDATDAIAQLIEQLNLGRVIVAGYSMGGVIAQYLGALHPDKVAGLVLSGTGYGGRTSGIRKLMRPILNLPVSLVRTGHLLFQLVKGEPREIVDETDLDSFESVRSWVFSEMRRLNLKAVAEASKDLMIYDTREHLPCIEVPTAVLITTTDEAFSREIQEEMADLIPKSSKHYFSGGHLSCLKDNFHKRFVEICEKMSIHIK